MARGALGQAIRDQRCRLGLSQAKVAIASGVERAHLTRIEGGRWVPRLDTLDRIAKALHTTTEILLSAKSKNGSSLASG